MHRRSALRGTRQFHATRQQPVWLIAAGVGCAGLFLGTRYILRAQERVRRRRAGLPEDDDIDEYDQEDHYDRGAHHAQRQVSQILGVDFGTTNLRLAVAAMNAAPTSQSVRVLETADGFRSLTAAVAVDNGATSVGPVAQSLLGRKPGYTATAIRVLLDQSKPNNAEREQFLQSLPYKVSVDGEHLQLELDGNPYSAEWAAEMLLDQLHEIAARSMPEHSHDGFPAVIAVPTGVNEQQRERFEQLATHAGFQVCASVDEAIAAVHAAELSAMEDPDASEFAKVLASASPQRIAVFDIGGYESSISVLQKHGSNYDVLSTASSLTFSGKNIDYALFQFVVDNFQKQHGIDLSIDHMARYRIFEAVETAKRELSARSSTDINLPFITADRTGAKHLIQKLTSFDLSRISETPTATAISLCERTLANIQIQPSDIDLLMVIGGSARSEYIRRQLESFFRQASFKSSNFRPEEAVVVGAAEFGRRLLSES